MNESSPLRKWLDKVEETGEIPKPPASDPNSELINISGKPKSAKRKPEYKKVPDQDNETDRTWDELPHREAKEWWHE